MCEEKKPKLLLLSETHVTDDIADAEISITDYDIVRCDSNSRHTGGVIMYIHSSLKWKLIHKKFTSKTWSLVISIDDEDLYGRYGILYKSPKEKINDFLEILSEMCDETINLATRNIIFGDMNINVGRKSKNVKKYLNVLENHNLYQCVNLPTRVTKKSATIIDHIISNVEQINWNINVESPTDHFLVEVSLSQRKKKIVDERRVKFTCWKNYSKEKIIDALKLMKWQNCENVNDEFHQHIKT